MPTIVNDHYCAPAVNVSTRDNTRELDTFCNNGKALAVAMSHSRDRYDPSISQNGYYLFQQAIMQQVTATWEKIYQLYTPLVRTWVVRHPSFANTGEEVDYFVNRAFEKMWLALTPEKFTNFPELKSLLAYLQMCVNSVIIDHLRIEKRYRLHFALSEEEQACAFVPTQNQFWYEVQRLHFWECIRKRLKNETEYKLLYYRFVLGIKPRQLCTQFRDIFPDVAVVYTLTQNILARLRRDPELESYLHDSELFGSLDSI